MGNASDRTMPKKAYAKCVANETVSHKKLVKKVTAVTSALSTEERASG